MKQILLLVVLVIISPAAFACNFDTLENCTPNDLPEITQYAASQLRSPLPMQVSRSLTIVSIEGIDTTMRFTALLHYTREDYDAALQRMNQSEVDVQSQLFSAAKNVVCRQDGTADFLKLGGALEYVYTFIEGGRPISVTVTTCAREIAL